MKHAKSLAALLLCAGLVLGGCSGKKAPVQTDITLGEETKGSEIVVIENESQITFTGVELKLLSEKNFGSSFLKDQEKFENGKTASLYVPAPEEKKGEEKTKEKEPVSLRFFDTKLVWQFDDFEYFDVSDKAVLTKDDKTLVLTYQSVRDKNEVTLRAKPDPVNVLLEEQQVESNTEDPEGNTGSENGEAIPSQSGSLDDPDTPDFSEGYEGDSSETSQGNSSSGTSSGNSGSSGSSQGKTEPGKEPDNENPSVENDEDVPIMEDPVYDPPVTENPRG